MSKDITFKTDTENVLEMVCPERLTGEALRQAIPQMQLVAKNMKWLLVDASSMRDYAFDVKDDALEFVREMKRLGLTKGAAVTNSPAVKILGKTVAAAGGFDLTFHDSRFEALRKLKAK